MYFYEDELDHFRDTAISLLMAERSSNNFIQEAGPASVQLSNLCHRLEQESFPATELADFTLDKLVQSVVDDQNKFFRLVGVLSQEEQSKEINKIKSKLNLSKRLVELINKLRELGDAVLHKQEYLITNAKYLTENEAMHRGDWSGNSRLILAIKRGETDRAKYFIERGLYCRASNSHGKTPLMFAAEKALDSIVTLLLPVSDIEAKSNDNQTALFYAVSSDHQSTCDLLLSAGARSDWIIEINGQNKSLKEIAHEYSTVKITPTTQVHSMHTTPLNVNRPVL